MPRHDKTGPEGKGPKTGRQVGMCEGKASEDSFPRGRGFCRGKGRGMRCRNMQPEDEKKILCAQLKEIEQRLAELA